MDRLRQGGVSEGDLLSVFVADGAMFALFYTIDMRSYRDCAW